MNKDLLLLLETAIDEHGVSTVLEHVATVCGEKAAHIRENNQGEKFAKLWDRIIEKIDHCATQVDLIN